MLNLQLTDQEVGLIQAALAELRLRDSMPLYTKINEQVAAQSAPQETKEKSE